MAGVGSCQVKGIAGVFLGFKGALELALKIHGGTLEIRDFGVGNVVSRNLIAQGVYIQGPVQQIN